MVEVEVTTKEQLDKLYEDSALTLVGLSRESIPDFFDWIRSLSEIKNEVAYIISGKCMNENYGLTGDNAYPDDLTIVSVMLSDIENPTKLALPRFQIGGRWFDDIVSNNAMREEA